MKPAPAPDDESLDELPPMDGDDGEEDEPADDLDDEDDGTADPFDDATGEADPVDDVTVENALGSPIVVGFIQETGLLDDAADSDELDIGADDLEIGERDDLLSDVDEPGVGEEDFGLGDDASRADADGGEEGPDAEDEELRVEDLPQLDADDEGELEDPALAERWLLGPEVTEEVRPAWDDRAWDRAVWVSRAALDVAGVAPGAVTALAVADGALLLGTDRAPRIFATRDEGQTFMGIEGWQARAHTLFADGVLFTDDALAVTSDRGAPVILLRGEGDELTITRGLQEKTSDPDVVVDAALTPNMVVSLAARASCLAVGQHGAGAYSTRDGATWSRIEGTASTTALAFVDDSTLLVALYSPAEERAWLVRVSPEGVANTVAELGGDDAEDLDVRVHSIVWDEARKLAWVAGAFGIAGFRRN